MIDQCKRNWAEQRFETHAKKAQELALQFSSTWGNIESYNRTKDEFPSFERYLGEVTDTMFDLQRAAAFVRSFDQTTDDQSRFVEHLQAARSTKRWWRDFEAKIRAEMALIESTLQAGNV